MTEHPSAPKVASSILERVLHSAHWHSAKALAGRAEDGAAGVPAPTPPPAKAQQSNTSG